MTSTSFRLARCLLRRNILYSLPTRYFSGETNVKDEIGKLVKKSKVVVFMKGNPDQPKCGFSNAVVQILRMHGVTYDAHDVLQRDEIRNGIKEYSNWPTIPQVFINGEFVGGCDIILRLHQTGNLISELEKAGIKSALVNTTPSDSNKSESSS